MEEYFYGLNKDILITKEQQLALSTVAWPLLMALNHAELSNCTLENENQLLCDCTEKSKQLLGILTGKKSSLTFPLKQICNIAWENTQAPESMGLGNPRKKLSDLEVPLEAESFEI